VAIFKGIINVIYYLKRNYFGKESLRLIDASLQHYLDQREIPFERVIYEDWYQVYKKF